MQVEYTALDGSPSTTNQLDDPSKDDGGICVAMCSLLVAIPALIGS